MIDHNTHCQCCKLVLKVSEPIGQKPDGINKNRNLVRYEIEDDVKKAIQKEKIAQVTSELNSDEEEFGKGRRAIKHKKFTDSSSDSDVSNLPTPKKFKKSTTKASQSTRITPSADSPSMESVNGNRVCLSTNNECQHALENVYLKDDVKKAIQKEKIARVTSELNSDEEFGKGRRAIKHKKCTDSDVGNLPTPKRFKKSTTKASQSTRTTPPADSPSMKSVNGNRVCLSTNNECQHALENVYIKGELASIKELCIQTKFEVRQCYEMLSTLIKERERSNEVALVPEIESLVEFESELPLKTMNQLDDLENKIKNNDTTRKQLLEFCKLWQARIGGETVEIQVKRTMIRVFSCELATLFSWEGEKQKRRLKDLTIISIIEKSISTGNLSALFTVDTFEKTAKEWVRQASTIIAQRKKTQIHEWKPDVSHAVNVSFRSDLNKVDCLPLSGLALQCTLPDPSNLKRLTERCSLCLRTPVSDLHVLTACPVALKEGRYTWRHDRVLGVIREAINLSIAKARRNIGQEFSIFEKSKDWTVLTDVANRHYEFPSELAVTSLCPDITVLSKSLKCAVLVELTVPWDTNIPKQHNYKLNKYADLCSNIRMKGFKCSLYAVEVSARGLTTKSMYIFLKDLGLGRKNIDYFMRRASKTAVESSNKIWLQRSDQWTQRGDSCGHTKDP